MSISSEFTSDYKLVGEALLSYEGTAALSLFSHFIDARAFEQFRVSIASISNSVLESYLDDILGEKISEDTLYVRLPYFNRSRIVEILSLLGVGAAVAVATHLSFSGTDPWWAFCIALLLGSPFGMFFHTVFGRTNRRIRLARVVSFELSRRRGDIDENTPGTKVSLRQILSPLSSPVTAPSQKVSLN